MTFFNQNFVCNKISCSRTSQFRNTNTKTSLGHDPEKICYSNFLNLVMSACSFSFLWGPVNHLRHLFSRDRLPFTAAYFGTLFATLYFALHVQSTPFTVLCAVGQIVALLWFLVSYIPGGQTGLQFCTRLFSSAVTSTVSKTLPVWWPLLQGTYLFSGKALLSCCLMSNFQVSSAASFVSVMERVKFDESTWHNGNNPYCYKSRILSLWYMCHKWHVGIFQVNGGQIFQ